MARLADPEDRWIRAAGLATRYWDTGNGAPVALLHGLGAHLGFWRAAVPGLASDYRVIVPDVPGFGRSERPREISRGEFVGWLADFLQRIEAVPCTLVGSSMGGAIATACALERPELFSALVLVDSTGLGRTVWMGFRLLTLPLIGEYVLRPRADGIRRLFGTLTYSTDWMWDGFVEESHEIAQVPGATEFFLRTLRWGCSLFGIRDRVLLLKGLPRLSVPTLLVWGRHDFVHPLRDAQKAVRLIPDGQLKVLEECGHMPHMERPAAFNALLREFLSSRLPVRPAA